MTSECDSWLRYTYIVSLVLAHDGVSVDKGLKPPFASASYPPENQNCHCFGAAVVRNARDKMGHFMSLRHNRRQSDTANFYGPGGWVGIASSLLPPEMNRFQS